MISETASHSQGCKETFDIWAGSRAVLAGSLFSSSFSKWMENTKLSSKLPTKNLGGKAEGYPRTGHSLSLWERTNAPQMQNSLPWSQSLGYHQMKHHNIPKQRKEDSGCALARVHPAALQGTAQGQREELQGLNSTRTGTKAHFPDSRSAFSRHKSMITCGCLESNWNCCTHQNLGLGRVNYSCACTNEVLEV